MKKINKSLMQVLGLSTLLSISSISFAEIIMRSGTAEGGASSISWSSDEVNQLLNDDFSVAAEEPSPAGSATITTTLRQGGSVQPAVKSPRILDTNHNISQPSVNARAALVMDAQTGEVLYSKNTNTALPIASITKLMTAVVISDARLNMSEQITLQQADFSCSGCKSSSSSLRAGDSMNRAEALLFALMKSENPAAAALARTYPGGRSAFVAAMNSKAKELGMYSTRFLESTGLHPGNIASARDLGILVNTASQYGLIRQFSTTPSYDFNLGYRVLKSNNTNALVRNGGWNINISKTGFINEAGRCVVMHTTLNNRPVAVVLLGANSSQARTNDATRLMTWVSSLPKRI
ncbi:serine hydrolase [Acinetobacter bohemicus]|uniref:serine hydrolase n=1 Tax=Acinetobacter TaxID=469 RepID=UPI00116DAF22|nr:MULTISPECIES: serine hydrolase [Acinetobacter]MCO8041111.1 serine hydrolase [Acinetobacter sp. S4400-12]MDM1781668.1 serine hydrolase [Acinetobacter indicus]MCU7224407.1 serine hydrolase [Acinetobacter bohemicus]QKQ71034.1 D-alanyl-D-alanine endopeptidase [Acinetobacter sp. 10FS3-1]TQR67705.1 D-alanyl-D-alanine endopeptidase [Acinetobacter sp. RF14B]